jgi:hypothetical protein
MEENEKITLNNGGNNNNNKPPVPGVPMDDEFQVPTEEVVLPLL